MILARQLLIALLVIATALLLATDDAAAQNSCRSACWQAYGTCYKATNNRPRCQSLLKRCLDGCIRPKREKK